MNNVVFLQVLTDGLQACSVLDALGRQLCLVVRDHTLRYTDAPQPDDMLIDSLSYATFMSTMCNDQPDRIISSHKKKNNPIILKGIRDIIASLQHIAADLEPEEYAEMPGGSERKKEEDDNDDATLPYNPPDRASSEESVDNSTIANAKISGAKEDTNDDDDDATLPYKPPGGEDKTDFAGT